MVFREIYNFTTYTLKKFGRNFNVIERADKLMDAEKRAASPHHIIQHKSVNQAMPEVSEEIHKRPDDLLVRLKDVKVDSMDMTLETSQSRKQLPENREPCDFPEFGFQEPKVVPEGKCSLKQALEFIMNNQDDPITWTHQAIAKKYNLKVSDVERVVNSFKAFELHSTGQTRRSKIIPSTLNVLGISKTNVHEIAEKSVDVTDEQKNTGSDAKKGNL